MKKKLVGFSAACIAAGLVFFFAALALFKFDLSKMDTGNSVTETYPVEDTFKNISVEAGCDVYVKPSEDGNCTVVCTDDEKIRHSVIVENGTLTIKNEDDRKWYEHIAFGFFIIETKITVYLPEQEYESFVIGTASGDVEVEGCNADAVTVETASGEVELESCNADTVTIKTASGDVGLESCNADTATIETTSGEAALKDCMAGSLEIETTSGDVQLEDCDADAIKIRTTSGDVNGVLLSEKRFTADTKGGEVDLPASASGGTCDIKTKSGDIEISLKDD